MVKVKSQSWNQKKWRYYKDHLAERNSLRIEPTIINMERIIYYEVYVIKN